MSMETNELKIGKVLEPEYKSYFDKIASTNEKYLNAKKIIISDVDGILTESSSYYTAEGKVAKKFGAYDTEMIKFLKTQGWKFLFISKDKNGLEITKKRISDLDCFFAEGGPDKRIEIINESRTKGHFEFVLYVGDSLSDIAVFREADFAATVNNAPDVVKEYCQFTAKHNGGFGGFADICYYIHLKLTSIF